MKYLLRAIAELLVIAAVLFFFLLLVASQLPEPAEMPAPPSPGEVSYFASKCPDRTVLIRNKLECRK